MGVSEVYRSSPVALATYDYFDSIGGVGFIKLYPMIGITGSTTAQYGLTTDATIVSNSVTNKIEASTDIDFDILVEVPFIVAAKEAVFNWRQACGGSSNAQVTWTVRHVDASSTETDIGTVIGETTPSSTTDKLLSFVTLTRKAFKKGEKLRINANVTINGSGASVPFDPAGLEASNDADGRSVTGTATVTLPIVIPQ